MYKNWTYSTGKLLAPETGIFYVREANGWKIYTPQTASRITKCGTTYRIQAQVEYPPEREIIASM